MEREQDDKETNVGTHKQMDTCRHTDECADKQDGWMLGGGWMDGWMADGWMMDGGWIEGCMHA